MKDIIVLVAMGEQDTVEVPKGSNTVKYNTWYYGRQVFGSAYPWCMTFVQWVFAEAGMPLPYKTASCSDLLRWYRENAPRCIVSDPQPGDIVIYNFGHTGIIYDVASTFVCAVEGNTDRNGSANGGGVLKRQRAKTTVTAYIRPVRKAKEEIEVFDPTKITDEQMGEILMRLTDAQIYDLMQRGNRHAGSLDAPDWSVDEYGEAIAQGVTDGTRPMATVTRLEAALMAKRASEKA